MSVFNELVGSPVVTPAEIGRVGVVDVPEPIGFSPDKLTIKDKVRNQVSEDRIRSHFFLLPQFLRIQTLANELAYVLLNHLFVGAVGHAHPTLICGQYSDPHLLRFQQSAHRVR